MARWVLFSCVVGVLVLLGGCGRPKAKTVKVNGMVYLGENALPEGEVYLVGEAGTAPDILQIKNGRFEGQAKPGKVKVEFYAFKEGEAPKDGMPPVKGSPPGKIPIIPPQYNIQTIFTTEVTDSGLKQTQFKLEEK